MTTNQQSFWIIQLSLAVRVVFPMCWKEPLGTGGKLSKPRKEEEPFPSWFELCNEVWPQESKHLSKSQVRNESRKQNAAHCWLVSIQSQPLSLFLWSCLCLLFYFLWIFKCQTSRPLPLTFQHLISQNTAPYHWQLHHVHLLEIKQNKILSALKIHA